MPKGLIVEVLRRASGSDCTNGGVTSRFNEFVLVDPALDEIFEATEKRPALKIVRRNIGGRPYVHAEPFDSVPSRSVGYMFGGNFITTTDSRFSDINRYPIPVHDRTETQEQHAHLSV